MRVENLLFGIDAHNMAIKTLRAAQHTAGASVLSYSALNGAKSCISVAQF